VNVTISGNSANSGGGIYCEDTNPSFDTVERCNIFLNSAVSGEDLFAWFTNIAVPIHVIVDTFTVLNPSENHAYPFYNFTFDILHAKEPLDTRVSEYFPDEFVLHPAYPNPFNPVSTLMYEIPEGSEVSLIIYDLHGREVTRLVDSYMELGYHQVQWDGRGSNGREIPSSIYIARLVTPEYCKSIKMVLLK